MPKRCDRNGCHRYGMYHPVVVVKDKNGGTAKVALSICVCDEHRKEARVDDFVSDDFWRKLIGHLESAGSMIPERSLTALAFEPVGKFISAGGRFRSV